MPSNTYRIHHIVQRRRRRLQKPQNSNKAQYNKITNIHIRSKGTCMLTNTSNTCIILIVVNKHIYAHRISSIWRASSWLWVQWEGPWVNLEPIWGAYRHHQDTLSLFAATPVPRQQSCPNHGHLFAIRCHTLLSNCFVTHNTARRSQDLIIYWIQQTWPAWVGKLGRISHCKPTSL